MPKSDVRYWAEKFEANMARDARAIRALQNAGWNVAVIWECQTKDDAVLATLLTNRLKNSRLLNE